MVTPARPVLLCRPAEQSTASAALLRAAGFSVIELPLTGIAAPARKPSARLLERACKANWLIYTSRHAVSGAQPWLQPQAQQRIAAIGASTARALRAAGWPVHWVPEEAHSEALLNAADAPDIAGSVLIVGGSGGRRRLKSELQSRGVAVEKLIAYRRIALTPTSTQWRAAVDAQPTLVFGSGHALRQWQALAQQYQQTAALNLPVLVASQRLCKLARQLGYTHHIQALSRMSDAALLAALQERNT